MVEEKFNVKIDYTLVPRDAANEEMSIMLSTNDLTGMDFPETMEEYISVLRWVNENDANGNGNDDEVPFCGSHGSLQVIGNLTGIQDSFSMDRGSGGQLIYAPLHKNR